MKSILSALVAVCIATAAFAADAPKAAARPAKAGARKASDAALAAVDAQIAAAKVDKSQAGWRTKLPLPKAVAFDAKKDYVAVVETNKGRIELKLDPVAAPLHVTNFVYLSRLGFYDGLSFHRVIPGFMAQGGDPLGNGTGGPGYDFGGEVTPAMDFAKSGLLSNANRGPNTDGSQFFITFQPTPWLKGSFCVFGEVISGQETLKLLEGAGSKSGKTGEPLAMTKVSVEARDRAK